MEEREDTSSRNKKIQGDGVVLDIHVLALRFSVWMNFQSCACFSFYGAHQRPLCIHAGDSIDE